MHLIESTWLHFRIKVLHSPVGAKMLSQSPKCTVTPPLKRASGFSGMEWWTGMVEWTGLEWWNGMDSVGQVTL